MKKNERFHMVLRSKQPKLIARLPDEIIFNILVLLPAHILCAVMRYVCRQWNVIINDPVFVTTHHLRAPSIFLLQDPLYRAHFFNVKETDINFSNIKFQFPGQVLATCNGLTLVRDRTTHRVCYIANPATNRIITLPAMPLNMHRCCVCLAFAASSNTYKVLVGTRDRISEYHSKYQCAILTVNVDRAWRLINCANLDNGLMFIFRCRSIVNSGFVYWGWGNGPSACMLSLNIESESIKTISLPQKRLSNCLLTYFRPKGNTISLIHVYRDYSIKVWVLKDHASEDWVTFPDLRVEEIRREVTNLLSLNHLDIYGRCNYLYPISWLKNEEKILFEMISVSNSLLVYDVKTGGTFTYIIDIDGLNMRDIVSEHGASAAIFPHLSSLTWVSGY